MNVSMIGRSLIVALGAAALCSQASAGLIATVDATIAAANTTFGGSIDGTPVVSLDTVGNIITVDSSLKPAASTQNGVVWVTQLNGSLPDGLSVLGGGDSVLEVDIRLLPANQSSQIFLRMGASELASQPGFNNFGISLAGLTPGDSAFTTLSVPLNQASNSGFSSYTVNDGELINFKQLGFVGSFGSNINAYEIAAIRVLGTVPEPSSLLILGLASLGMAVGRRRC